MYIYGVGSDWVRSRTYVVLVSSWRLLFQLPSPFRASHVMILSCVFVDVFYVCRWIFWNLLQCFLPFVDTIFLMINITRGVNFEDLRYFPPSLKHVWPGNCYFEIFLSHSPYCYSFSLTYVCMFVFCRAKLFQRLPKIRSLWVCVTICVYSKHVYTLYSSWTASCYVHIIAT